VTAPTATALTSSAREASVELVEFDHVLAGQTVAGAAAELAAQLDPGFLREAGWDPESRVLSLPAEHPLLGRRTCRVDGCTFTVKHGSADALCWWCSSRLAAQGLSGPQIESLPELPPLPDHPAGCAVPGCQRMSPGPRCTFCVPHSKQFRYGPCASLSLEEFVSDARVRPLPALGPCRVAACTRRIESGHDYCPAHDRRWRIAVAADPGIDRRHWQATQPAVPEPGQVSLRGLPPSVVVEVLFGVQHRVHGGGKVKDVTLRAVGDALRRGQVSVIADLPVEAMPSQPTRSLLTAIVRNVRRALTDPAQERAGDNWDLAVFGHPGRLSFVDIGQPWLADAAKAWAAQELPRHRGGGGGKVRGKINALARLSETLRARDDRGLVPDRLGRNDIETFLNRLAYLESAGRISRQHRTAICRDSRATLAGIRALGLTRPGQIAAGLPGDFALGRDDIPAEPVRPESGRDLPPEIIAALCDNLGSLHPVEIRTATQIAIDTGRRPEDIVALTMDCLQHDKDGSAVLVYDNAKANRPGRRLPITRATAAVITAQQARVRARFPETPLGELKLLPTPRRNPDGRRAFSIDALANRHRAWVNGLGTLRRGDGTEFDSTRIILYAYRHTYAQRHADAGVAIDVLAELLDHRNLDVTRGYYRVGEDRRRAAVDTVSALSFDRHGNRIWRQAAALLDTEHARYAVGEVAVPYGRCTEPSNVQAGGGACPIRFRCAGCDHFRTDVSYLPDLAAHLDDLLRTRERLAAALDGVDDWARADATPTQQEITRIRQLITRINGDLDQTTPADRAAIRDAVAVIRRHRATHLGMPAARSTTTDHTEVTG
jgi:integrase